MAGSVDQPVEERVPFLRCRRRNGLAVRRGGGGALLPGRRRWLTRCQWGFVEPAFAAAAGKRQRRRQRAGERNSADPDAARSDYHGTSLAGSTIADRAAFRNFHPGSLA